MACRVCLWILLLNCLALALQKDERNKRFMVLQAASKGQVPKEALKSNTWHQYKDWSPTNEYPFPKEARAGAVRAAPRPSGAHLKEPARLRWRAGADARADRVLLDGEQIAREHAKLVQDINGLSESYPGWMRHRDDYTTTYRSELKDESIYMENLESVSAAPSPPPVVTTPARPPAVNLKIVPAVIGAGGAAKPAGALPLLVLGGGEAKHRLAATRHPYPFVGAASTARPARLRPLAPLAYPMRLAAPTLWQRFLAIFPKIIRIGATVPDPVLPTFHLSS